MQTKSRSLSSFLDRRQVEVKPRRVNVRPDMDLYQPGSVHWFVEFKCKCLCNIPAIFGWLENHAMYTYFSTSPGDTRKPDALDIFTRWRLELEVFAEHEGYESWRSELTPFLGDVEVRRRWFRLEERALRLREFFGDEGYSECLKEVGVYD